MKPPPIPTWKFSQCTCTVWAACWPSKNHRVCEPHVYGPNLTNSNNWSIIPKLETPAGRPYSGDFANTLISWHMYPKHRTHTPYLGSVHDFSSYQIYVWNQKWKKGMIVCNYCSTFDMENGQSPIMNGHITIHNFTKPSFP